jgi:hypothetical protein
VQDERTEQSEQLPEEAPPDQVTEEGQGGSAEESRENPGAEEGERGEATGNPRNAG